MIEAYSEWAKTKKEYIEAAINGAPPERLKELGNRFSRTLARALMDENCRAAVIIDLAADITTLYVAVNELAKRIEELAKKGGEA